MTKDVRYKECTCDLCGSKECIPPIKILPPKWEVLNLKGNVLDLCEQCFLSVEQAVEDIKKGFETKKCY